MWTYRELADILVNNPGGVFIKSITSSNKQMLKNIQKAALKNAFIWAAVGTGIAVTINTIEKLVQKSKNAKNKDEIEKIKSEIKKQKEK